MSNQALGLPGLLLPTALLGARGLTAWGLDGGPFEALPWWLELDVGLIRFLPSCCQELLLVEVPGAIITK